MNKALLAGGLLLTLAVVACGGDDDNTAAFSAGPTSSDNAGKSTGGTNAAGSPAGGGTTGGTATSGPSASPSQNGATPGASSASLTAGVWDDNLNFDWFKKYVSLAGDPVVNAFPSFSDAERANAQKQWSGTRGVKTELDLAFMIDTTGSMGDELSYIQSSVDGIASTIKANHPNLNPHFGLVVYRDFVDDYQTRTFDFADEPTFKSNIAPQSASGGGDYPEDVADGMTSTLGLGWRTTSDVARMVIWIADAPPHENQADSVKTSISAAATKDIHFYPVAASGADNRTEFTMRTAAQMTGGRYVFLTDDSGIGDSHEEPHIPCYVVTPFNDAINRMVESELSGKHIDAPASDVLRTVGNPQGGVCATQSNINVSIY